MKNYYLTHWILQEHKEVLIEKQALNTEDLYKQLLIDFPDEQILIQGFDNFQYITTLSHIHAAGYSIINPSLSYNLSPAHFMRNFFYILKEENEAEM